MAPAGTGTTNGTNPTDDGEVVITYDAAKDACPKPPTPPEPAPGPGPGPDGAAVAVVAQPRFTG